MVDPTYHLSTQEFEAWVQGQSELHSKTCQKIWSTGRFSCAEITGRIHYTWLGFFVFFFNASWPLWIVGLSFSTPFCQDLLPHYRNMDSADYRLKPLKSSCFCQEFCHSDDKSN
jgi:hypothetical protein